METAECYTKHRVLLSMPLKAALSTCTSHPLSHTLVLRLESMTGTSRPPLSMATPTVCSNKQAFYLYTTGGHNKRPFQPTVQNCITSTVTLQIYNDKITLVIQKYLFTFRQKSRSIEKTGCQHQKEPERISNPSPLFYTWGNWVPRGLTAFPEWHNWFMLIRNQNAWLLKSGLNLPLFMRHHLLSFSAQKHCSGQPVLFPSHAHPQQKEEYQGRKGNSRFKNLQGSPPAHQLSRQAMLWH